MSAARVDYRGASIRVEARLAPGRSLGAVLTAVPKVGSIASLHSGAGGVTFELEPRAARPGAR